MTLLSRPLDSIDAEALPRDRSSLDPAALAALQRSIAATGLRQPIEVFELADPAPPLRYGLIPGLRRRTASRALSAANPTRPATIDAFLRSPESLPQAVTRMVEENDIRAERMLGAELTAHLSYDAGAEPPPEKTNRRNGVATKRVTGSDGQVPLVVPRDREGSFERQLVKKGETRIDGVDDKSEPASRHRSETAGERALSRRAFGARPPGPS
jgi:hypothetical protein